MKTLIAWWLITVNWQVRPMYAALSQLFAGRAYGGVNPLKLLFDGLMLLLVGLLITLMPLIAVISFPVTSLYFMLFNRDEYRQVRDLVRAGRIGWSTGTVLDAEKDLTDGQG